MRIPILLAAMAMAAATPAVAADLGEAEPLPTPDLTAAAPANDWTGFYLGALLGWTWGNAGTDEEGDIEGDGIDGGVYAGGNWQFGQFVLGAEGDLLLSGAEGSEDDVEFDQGVNGSLRARAGIALDRFLLYGTGGVAATELELSDDDSDDSNTLWGWTVGAGAEALVLDNVTARVEYRYSDYQDKEFRLDSGEGDSDFSTNSVRAGVGVKF
jgi:outer membrane immunogenic protein